MLHERGECKPCAYFHHKEDGCRGGDDCKFCHLCTREALKERKKLKLQKLKEKRVAGQGRNVRRGLALDSRSQMPTGPKEKMNSWGSKEGMTMNPPPRKEHDESDDETTQAPSEPEITEMKFFTPPPGLGHLNITDMMIPAPPGLERLGLRNTLAMHGPPGQSSEPMKLYSVDWPHRSPM